MILSVGTRPLSIVGDCPGAVGNGHLADTKMSQSRKVRLFIKPFCGWCSQAMDWLDEHDIRYEVLDVIADEKAYDEMYRVSGQTLTPVIDVDGKILAEDRKSTRLNSS